MLVRLTHIDGKLPNCALMRLAHHFRQRGDRVVLTRDIALNLFEPPAYDLVFASSIFSMSARRVAEFRRNFPDAIVGGTGTGDFTTLEQAVADLAPREVYDYSVYPDFRHSIGFLTRGCRLKCKFCVVPQKEGRPVGNMTVAELWRGDPHPKNLLLLDNDFFALDDWRAAYRGHNGTVGFRVCFSQGINIRLISEEAAEALSQIQYRDTKFSRRRIYTAWDSMRDEGIFFRGIDRLEAAGIPSSHVMAYMLVGYDPAETWCRIHSRFDKMVKRGILPYPMVYDPSRRDLRDFQRWAITGLYRAFPFSDYRPRGPEARRPT